MALLSVSGLEKIEKENWVVKDLSFTQSVHEKIAIAGTTGSGKTTLLKMIASLIQPSAGEIYFQGKKVMGPIDQLIPGHPGIAYLSQHFELRNNYSVREILEMANKISDKQAEHIYAICQITHLLGRKTDAISGGERQRIALAGLLTGSPKLLLLDEPFSNLDMMHKKIMKTVIEDIGNQLNISCIMVLHDALDILSWANRILVMQAGKIIQSGSPEAVYHRPINEYTAGLLGMYNLIDNDLAKRLGIQVTDGSTIVRPEQFSIATSSNHMLAGTIQKKLFWGSYTTLEVLVGNKPMTILAHANDFIVGNEIYLNFHRPNFPEA